MPDPSVPQTPRLLQGLGWQWTAQGPIVSVRVDGKTLRVLVPIQKVWLAFDQELALAGVPNLSGVGCPCSVAGFFDGMDRVNASCIDTGTAAVGYSNWWGVPDIPYLLDRLRKGPVQSVPVALDWASQLGHPAHGTGKYHMGYEDWLRIHPLSRPILWNYLIPEDRAYLLTRWPLDILMSKHPPSKGIFASVARAVSNAGRVVAHGAESVARTAKRAGLAAVHAAILPVNVLRHGPKAIMNQINEDLKVVKPVESIVRNKYVRAGLTAAAVVVPVLAPVAVAVNAAAVIADRIEAAKKAAQRIKQGLATAHDVVAVHDGLAVHREVTQIVKHAQKGNVAAQQIVGAMKGLPPVQDHRATAIVIPHIVPGAHGPTGKPFTFEQGTVRVLHPVRPEHFAPVVHPAAVHHHVQHALPAAHTVLYRAAGHPAAHPAVHAALARKLAANPIRPASRAQTINKSKGAPSGAVTYPPITSPAAASAMARQMLASFRPASAASQLFQSVNQFRGMLPTPLY